MAETVKNEVSKAGPRYLLIDVVRGLAIIGVVVYHLVWDLRFLQFTTTNMTFDIAWLWLARVLQVTFFALTGISLVLAHRRAMHWRAFWWRFLIIASAAMLVTLGTFLLFGQGFVYFGMLHALAVLSVLAVPFIRAPLWLVIGAAVLSIWAPFVYQNEIFNVRYLSWIGFWTQPPYTQDLQSIFPGLGYVLAGVALMRIILDLGLSEPLERIKSSSKSYHALVKAGRWSLVIYLVHQPILLSVLYPLSMVMQPGAGRVAEVRVQQKQMFYDACVGAYVNSQGQEGDAIAGQIKANSYCSCAMELMDENNLFGAQSIDELSAQQKTVYGAIPKLCQAMAQPSPG
ncbi:protein of unknown function DUF1624 [hydrothermal vent metagenome]|uniref:Heparan-alpha-glucosaminide N-acetyltransferase catalytic domain-containing protein n=1 Tax=hydrothermal vent metagenome TaxID=652676 RepID=A0A3B0UMM9_9ZZZZ